MNCVILSVAKNPVRNLSNAQAFDSNKYTMIKKGYLYILASKRNGTLYVGVTSDLENRIYQHKNKTIKGFTSKHNINNLVYYEEYNNIREAIEREKFIKGKKRIFKVELIEKINPEWNDLSEDWIK